MDDDHPGSVAVAGPGRAHAARRAAACSVSSCLQVPARGLRWFFRTLRGLPIDQLRYYTERCEELLLDMEVACACVQGANPHHMQALLAGPYSAVPSTVAQDVAVMWAAGGCIHLMTASNKVHGLMVQHCSSGVSCLAHDAAGGGRVWWGTEQGSVGARLITGGSTAEARVVPVQVAQAAITALVVEGACCWAGTQSGDVYVISRSAVLAGPRFQELKQKAPDLLPSPATSSCVPGGTPVVSIVAGGGKVFAAAGKGTGGATLRVWDSGSQQLLEVLFIDKQETCERSPVTSMCLSDPTALSPAASLPAAAPPSPMASCGFGYTSSVINGNGSPAAPQQQQQEQHDAPFLITGHQNGLVVFWDTSGSKLRPLLLLPPRRGCRWPVKSIDVMPEAGLLVLGVQGCPFQGISCGKVVLHALPPKMFPAPGTLHTAAKCHPRTVLLPAHRLGLRAAVVTGYGQVVTAGRSGSVKVWDLTQEGLQKCCGPAGSGTQRPVLQPTAATLHKLVSTPTFSPRRPAAQQQQQQHGQQSVVACSTSLDPCQLQQPSPFLGAPPLSTAFSPSLSPKQLELQQQEQQQVGQGAQLQSPQQAGEQDAKLQLAPQPKQLGGNVSLCSDQQPAYCQPQRQGQGPRLLWHSSTQKWAAELSSSKWVIQQDELLEPAVPNGQSLRLGAGSFGSVERRVFRHKDVAVKFIKEAGWNQSKLSALRKEVEVLMQLHHPNVLMLMGVCLEPPAVVTELCEQGSLFKLLQQVRRKPELAASLDILSMAIDIALGMVYLHSQGILHRDIKSPNLFVTRTGEVKVGDLGLSRLLDVGESGVTTVTRVNPKWSAPEMLGSDPLQEHVTFSVQGDVFSFGIVAWELLTKQEPWDDEIQEGLAAGRFPRHAEDFYVASLIRQGRRPVLPSIEKLQAQPGVDGLKPQVLKDYISLLHRCWEHEPHNRPSYGQVVENLKAMQALQLSNSAADTGRASAAAAAAFSLRGLQRLCQQ